MMRREIKNELRNKYNFTFKFGNSLANSEKAKRNARNEKGEFVAAKKAKQ